VITVTSDGNLGASIDALTRQLAQANRAVGVRVGKVAEREIAAAASVKRLSGMNAKLRAKTKVFPGAQSVTIDVQATPAGPWSIAESGRRGGYTIRPRTKRAVTAPTPFASVVARAAGGRQVWSRAVAAATPAIERELEAVYDDALTED
jgi:hypothetical protein